MRHLTAFIIFIARAPRRTAHWHMTTADSRLGATSLDGGLHWSGGAHSTHPTAAETRSEAWFEEFLGTKHDEIWGLSPNAGSPVVTMVVSIPVVMVIHDLEDLGHPQFWKPSVRNSYVLPRFVGNQH